MEGLGSSASVSNSSFPSFNVEMKKEIDKKTWQDPN